MLKELQGLETAHPEFNDPHSPTQRVGEHTRIFPIVHAERMYSLDNTYSPEELGDWIKRIEKRYGSPINEFTCELKLMVLRLI